MSNSPAIKIVVNVPSIRPDSYSTMRMSAGYLTNLRHDVSFDLIAQYPWQSDAAYESCHSYTMMPRLPMPSMVNLRFQTIAKYRFDSDYIMFIDDDLIYHYGASEYFSRVFNYLADYRPAVLSIFGSRYPQEFVKNPKNCIMTTNRGLLVRSDLLSAFSPDMFIFGGCEEPVIAYHALHKVREHVVIGGAPVARNFVKHLEVNSESPIHDQHIYEQNAEAYIRDKYNDNEWNAISGEFPKGL